MPEDIYIKTVDDALVASIRFWGQFDEVPQYFDKVYAHARPYVDGREICLYHCTNTPKGHELEVCVPVSQPVEAGEVSSRVLRGGEMLCMRHTGPYDTLGKGWGWLWRYAVENTIGIAEGASREVYLEDPSDHGDDASKYVTELMMPLLLPLWKQRLSDGVARAASEAARDDVMAGGDLITVQSSPIEKAEWARGAVARLDAAVDADTAQHEVMPGCAHVYPVGRIAQIRAACEGVDDIEQIVSIVNQTWGGAPYELRYEDGAPVIYVTKSPFMRQRWEEATDPAEKRAAYCHCALVRAAIRAEMDVSRTFCYCGAGYFKQVWEGVLGRPVRVELVDSVLQGGEGCTFAIMAGSR